MDPKHAVAFNNLGVAYAKQGNLDVAMECYKKATSINPNYAAAFSNIGVTFYKLGYL
ncbi:MAG: tetratricopeptide repeat protein [Candidatus Aminicenantes bacterium]|nr:tetratricopeptide repeat protein [Candidatus Aminicenantes bacterium]